MKSIEKESDGKIKFDVTDISKLEQVAKNGTIQEIKVAANDALKSVNSLSGAMNDTLSKQANSVAAKPITGKTNRFCDIKNEKLSNDMEDMSKLAGHIKLDGTIIGETEKLGKETGKTAAKMGELKDKSDKVKKTHADFKADSAKDKKIWLDVKDL